ncbi:hypothetical protein AB4254_11325 [Vibrio breoganii]
MDDFKLALIPELYPECFDLKLMTALGHYFHNFDNHFKGKSPTTFVLTAEGSALFRADVHNGAFEVGVPNELFDIMINTPLYSISFLERTPGMFLAIKLGYGDKAKVSAIRIFQRRKRVQAFGKFDTVSMYRMDKSGARMESEEKYDEFKLPVRVLEKPNW